MARVAPNSGSKALYFLCILSGATLLYLDITYKSFDNIKNIYISTTISSKYLLKKITFDPFIYLYEISSSKSQLINENKRITKKKKYKDIFFSLVILRKSFIYRKLI